MARIEAGVTSSGLMVPNGEDTSLTVYGIASSTTMAAGGVMYVKSSGTADVGGSALNTVMNGGVMSVCSNGYALDTGISSGASVCVSSSYVDGTIINSKGYLYVKNNGVAENTVVSAGGSILISANGTANNTTLYGAMRIYNTGASVVSTTVESGGNMQAQAAGNTEVLSTTINSNGTLRLSSAVATSTTINGGNMYVAKGATAIDTIVNGGTVEVQIASAEETPACASNTTLNGGVMNVSSGCLASDTTLNEGGRMVVFADGEAKATIISGGTLIASEGATLNGITLQKHPGSRFEISAGYTVQDVTVSSGAIVYIRHGADVSNLNILAGGSAWSIYDTVNGGTIAGEVNLKPESAGALNGIVLREGAKVYNNGGDVFVVSESVAPTGDEPAPVKDDIDLTNGGIFAYNDESGAKQTRLATDGDLFLNGNTVTMSALSLDFGTYTDAKVYAGKSLGTEGDYNVGGSLNLNNVDLAGVQVFGGGKIASGINATIVGDIDLKLSGDTDNASRIYVGYDVEKAAGNTVSVEGNSVLNVSKGTYDYIRGGSLASGGENGTMQVAGKVATHIYSVAAKSVVGDYQVGGGWSFARTGDSELYISDGASISGSVAGAGVSFGGAYTLTGNTKVHISGGSLTGSSIFGGVTIGSTGAVAISEKCEIKGNVSITIDSSENDVIIGKSSNKVTSIFAGSYAKGIVGGDATLTLKGDSSKLQLLSADDGVVEFIGDSTLATNRKGYVKGSSSLVFDGFTCEGTDVLNVQNIAGFDTIEFKNGSNVQIGYLDTLADVSTWKFNAVDGLTVFNVADVGIANDFAGDTIDITFEDSLNSCTLMEMESTGEDVDVFGGLENAIVKFNGGSALAWDSTAGAFSDGTFSLSVVDDKSLVLSKLA